MLYRLFAVTALLLLSACVDPSYRAAVATFGETTAAAVETQQRDLSVIVENERERIAHQLAEEAVDLRLVGAECVSSENPPPPCRLRRPDGQELETAETYDNIIALGTALKQYSANLAALAAESNEDRAALNTAAANLATSFGGLYGETRIALGASADPTAAPRLGAIASIASALGGLYLENRRAEALQSIVIAADPTVQEAAGYLQQAYEMQAMSAAGQAFGNLRSLQGSATRLVSDENSTVAQRRQAQDALFESLAAYNRLRRGRNPFDAIGRAHGALAEAARRGATAESLRPALAEIMAVAQTIRTAAPQLRGGTQNGDGQ